MNVAHDPSMDDILKSIRRIIRSDQDEPAQAEKETMQQASPIQDLPPVIQEAPIAVQNNTVALHKEPRKKEDHPIKDDNLIKMEIHDQKRVRILEKKLQTIEMEYEQKLQLHRQKMTDYRRQNKELSATVDAYKSKLLSVSASLKTAHECLEKLQDKNRSLKSKVLEMARLERSSALLKTIQREFFNLYHPDRVKGDKFSKLVRHEVYNEFSQILQGVRTEFESRRL